MVRMAAETGSPSGPCTSSHHRGTPDAGGDTSPAAALKANLAAARDLPRQLRLRGLGGQITVDFAPMPKKDRHILDQSLKASFRAESSETTLAGWTPLGNFEIQRKRDRMPLSQCLPR